MLGNNSSSIFIQETTRVKCQNEILSIVLLSKTFCYLPLLHIVSSFLNQLIYDISCIKVWKFSNVVDSGGAFLC